MKAIAVASKVVKEYIRNRRTLLLALLIPIAFMLIFGFAFGGDNEAPTYHVSAFSQDGSARPYFDALAAVEHPNGANLFSVNLAPSLGGCLESVEARDALLCIEAPNNFQSASRAVVKLHSDPTNAAGQAATDAASRVLAQFNPNSRVSAQQVPITAPDLTTFDFVAPGLMVFAVMNFAPQIASLLAREVSQGTLVRLRLSRLGATEYLAGVSLGQLAVSLVALLLMFGTAAAMGFHFDSLGRAALALGVAVVATLAVLGAGLIIAAFSRNPEHAAGLGVLVAVPGSFLSGAFFPMPTVNLFKIGGHMVQVYDILPTTHAIRALRSLLTFRQDVDAIAFDVVALLILSALFFGVGAWLYSRMQFRVE
jgi:ABC-2 type transport system permease protein